VKNAQLLHRDRVRANVIENSEEHEHASTDTN
jgi:hypothetical protein